MARGSATSQDVLKRPGVEPVATKLRDVPALVAELEAIGDDSEKFNAFLGRVA